MLKSRGLRAMAVVAQAILCLSGPLYAQTSQKIESVLIETSKPYTKVVSDIQALGGRVKQQYQYVDAVAAEVPSNAMGTLRALTGPGRILHEGARQPLSRPLYPIGFPCVPRLGRLCSRPRGAGCMNIVALRSSDSDSISYPTSLEAVLSRPSAVHEAGPPTPPKPRLLDRVREAVRARHCSRRTEKTYVAWIRRYILFHGKRHPAQMGPVEITQFLSWLAVKGKVAASTQNQALSALLFLYRAVLEHDLP